MLSLYRCNYLSAVAHVAACEATLVRLCKNSTVFAELDRSRSKNWTVFTGLDIIMLVV